MSTEALQTKYNDCALECWSGVMVVQTEHSVVSTKNNPRPIFHCMACITKHVANFEFDGFQIQKVQGFLLYPDQENTSHNIMSKEQIEGDNAGVLTSPLISGFLV